MLSPERIEELRQDLLAERDRLQSEVSDASMDPDLLATQGNVSMGNELAEDASAMYEQESLLSLRHEQQSTLDQVNLALERIANGTYGTCERCGREIDFARLKARPYTRYCLDDERFAEQQSSGSR